GLESAACFGHPARRAGAAEPIGRTLPLCERSGVTGAHGAVVPEQSRERQGSVDATRPLARRSFCPKQNVPSAPCSRYTDSLRNHQVAIGPSFFVTASRRRSSYANCESES